MEHLNAPKETITHKTEWLPGASLVSGIFAIYPVIIFTLMRYLVQPYESYGLQGLVMTLLGGYTAFGGIVFGLPSVILGIIALIRIRKGVYGRSQMPMITLAMILGTLGILVGIPFTLINIFAWLYGWPD